MLLMQSAEKGSFTLTVQVPNNQILTQNLYNNYYYPRPKYLIIGYLGPLGYRRQIPGASLAGHIGGCIRIMERK